MRIFMVSIVDAKVVQKFDIPASSYRRTMSEFQWISHDEIILQFKHANKFETIIYSLNGQTVSADENSADMNVAQTSSLWGNQASRLISRTAGWKPTGPTGETPVLR